MTLISFRHAFIAALLSLCVALVPQLATAQSVDPFENGWTLDGGSSRLRFMSIKKGNLAETHSFAKLDGTISGDGKAQIRVALDSVDTKIDLRNVRMRFLFFETFLYPEATISARLDPGALADLNTVLRKVVPLNFTLSLHGVSVEITTQVVVTLVNNDRVAVSSATPIALTLSEFNLEGGREKLQETAKVTIVPLGIVSFDFVFDRVSPGTQPARTPAARTQAKVPTGVPSANVVTLTVNEVGRSLQGALKQRGCYAGSIDGVFGRNSKNGLAAFARQAGVPISLPHSPDAQQLGAALDIVRAFPDATCPHGATPRPAAPKPATVPTTPKAKPAPATGQAESGTPGYSTRSNSSKLVPRTAVDCFGSRAKFYDCD
jgi:polyisoprenoid-binding protein YceI